MEYKNIINYNKISKTKKLLDIIFTTAILVSILYIVFTTGYVILNSNMEVFEVRDNAGVQVVNLLSKGINPYSSEYLLTNEAPRVVFDSGFLNLLPAVIFVKLGMSPAMAAYFIGFIYLCAASFLTWLLISKLTKSKLLGALGAYLSFIMYTRQIIVSLRPDNLCALLILIIIFLIYKNIENEKFSLLSLHLLAICCVLLFFLKVNYSLITLSLLIFFLITNKSALLKLILFGVFYTIVFSLVLYFLFPTHLPVWTVRILEMFQGVDTLSIAVKLNVSITKYVYLVIVFLPIVIAAVGQALIFVFKMITSKKILRFFNDNKMETFLLINIVINGIALLSLGAHNGAGYWYYTYMLFPSVFILATIWVSQYTDKKRIICYLFVLFTIFQSYGYLSSCLAYPKFNNIKSQYASAFETIEKYKSDDMFLAMPLSGYSIENDIYNYNYGDTVYVPRKKPANKIFNAIFPFYNSYIDKYSEYLKVIDEKTAKKEYSVIIPDFDFRPSNLEDYYYKTEEFHILFWNFEAWLPKE